mgnify:FL=1
MKPTFFHPLSGAVILVVDWLAFGADSATVGLTLALTSAAAFLVTFSAVAAVQMRLRGDAPRQACLKALLGAAAAGVPLPIAGTFVGAAILALSGLKRR